MMHHDFSSCGLFLYHNLSIAMALSLSISKVSASIKLPSHHPKQDDHLFSPSFFNQNFQLIKALQRNEFIRNNITNQTTTRATFKTNESLSPLHHDPQSLSDRWRQIHGEDDWAGLLDPMDPILRSELIRYGEMAQACYDAFDYDHYSIYCGSCKHAPADLFRKLEIHQHGYDVSRYLFATSNVNLPNFVKLPKWQKAWSKKANWIGYVAVSNDEMSKRLGRRDIAVAWRGTVTQLEWVADLMDYLHPVSSEKIPCPDPSVKVQSGFVNLYTDKDENCRFSKNSAREQILTEVKRLIEKYHDEDLSITTTGHSLGSALATLSAYDIVETGINIRRNTQAVPVCVFSFSGPRVGNIRFKERVELLGLKVLRVVNVHDMVPKSPGVILNEKAPHPVMKFAEGLPWYYSHVGVELNLDHKDSPFLKPNTDLVCAHNLEALLHLIDGYHGKGKKFAITGRDIALVNKACDFLKDHHCIPPSWRQDHNKGMTRNKEGRWVQPQRHFH